MSDFLKKVADFYINTNKKTVNFREQLISKDLEKEKLNFLEKYKKEPNESQVLEIKKQIMLRKGLTTFIVFIIFLIVVINAIS
ncbi:hypothetical protein MXL46_14035 [Heyndrickxia sporothermodurans]|uniref:hypothetical protein n=1 Tax=Heyndrickxia sporothermodurans TaxID=46224 RepID=UPI002DBF1E60|nr:hypothetical protein [Heyndrickxia sporothermodurans]MEB6550211.1 hypothetical protein [Heyndrickxia sporothermodurans]